MKIINVTNKLNPTKPLIPLKIETVRFIVIHHTAVSSATYEEINKWHKDNDSICAGYNEFIRKNGDVYILRGDNVGAHTSNWNSLTYGISLEGDYSKEKVVPEEQYNSLVSRINHNIKRFSKNCQVVGHKDLNSTECPGQHFAPYMTKLINDMYRKDDSKMENISEWAKEAQKFVQDNKISDGTRAREKVTREEIWVMLYNFYKILKDKAK